MADIITTKNGRLHIYVRQDKYKGKLKSENWVGRTFHNGKQKVISSGTTNLEEAKVILEKWYDDLISGSIPENDVVKLNDDNQIGLLKELHSLKVKVSSKLKKHKRLRQKMTI